MRHELSVELIGTHHERKSSPWPAGAGTRVVMTVPVEVYDKQLVGQRFHPVRLARGFALGNPHVQIEVIANPAFCVVSEEDGFAGDLCLYPTVTSEDRWRKYVSGDYGSPRWYDLEAFTDLVLCVSQSPNPAHSVSSSAGSPG